MVLREINGIEGKDEGRGKMEDRCAWTKEERVRRRKAEIGGRERAEVGGRRSEVGKR